MNNISIVMYHYVRELQNSRYPTIKGLNMLDFKKQINFFKKNYNFISTELLIEALDKKSKLPSNAMLLTFDDGYLDHFTNVYPVLRSLGIPGFFSMPGKIIAERKVLDVNKIHFILASSSTNLIIESIRRLLDYYRGHEYDIPSFEYLYKKLGESNRFDSAEVIFIKRLLQVELEERLRNNIVDDLFKEFIDISEDALCCELYMNEDQIKIMKKDGMHFGIHGYDHYWMNRLRKEDLEIDIKKALNTFNGIVDKSQWVCCYPYGSYDDSVINTVKNYGAVAGFNTVVRTANIETDDRYALPRFDTNDFPPKKNAYISRDLLPQDGQG